MAGANRSIKQLAAEHKKRSRLLFAAVIFAAGSLLFSFFFGELGLAHFFTMKKVANRYRQEIKTITQQNQELAEEIRALKQDPLYIERLARERLGFVKQGEISYEFYEESATATPK